MPRCYTIKKTNGQTAANQSICKAKGVPGSNMSYNSHSNAAQRKPITSSTMVQKKKKTDVAPVSPTEASIAPAYYNNGPVTVHDG